MTDNHAVTPAPILDTLRPDPRPPLITAEPVDLVIEGTHAVAWVSGEIDLSNAADVLEHSALALADPRVDALVVDLSLVSFLDSTGLGALIQLRNQANQAGKRLALRGITAPVTKILALTKLDELFGLTADNPGRC